MKAILYATTLVALSFTASTLAESLPGPIFAPMPIVVIATPPPATLPNAIVAPLLSITPTPTRAAVAAEVGRAYFESLEIRPVRFVTDALDPRWLYPGLLSSLDYDIKIVAYRGPVTVTVEMPGYMTVPLPLSAVPSGFKLTSYRNDRAKNTVFAVTGVPENGELRGRFSIKPMEDSPAAADVEIKVTVESADGKQRLGTQSTKKPVIEKLKFYARTANFSTPEIPSRDAELDDPKFPLAKLSYLFEEQDERTLAQPNEPLPFYTRLDADLRFRSQDIQDLASVPFAIELNALEFIDITGNDIGNVKVTFLERTQAYGELNVSAVYTSSTTMTIPVNLDVDYTIPPFRSYHGRADLVLRIALRTDVPNKLSPLGGGDRVWVSFNVIPTETSKLVSYDQFKEASEMRGFQKLRVMSEVAADWKVPSNLPLFFIKP